jgi:two-component system sensor histidine kinase YesM
MKMRFGSTFKYLCSVPEEVSCCKMPKFCLQPLVENSILHGVSKNQAGIILLKAEKFEDVVEFTVTDNGEGAKKDDIDKILRPETQTNGKITGLGLANVDKRIKIMFGEEYGLTIDRDVTIGFKIRLKIPVIV